MADSPVFEWVADALERNTSFDRLQARGTVRIALRKAGLDPVSVTREDMIVVLEQTLPRELRSRKVSDEVKVCRNLVAGLRVANVPDTPAAPNAEDALSRMFNEPPTK